MVQNLPMRTAALFALLYCGTACDARPATAGDSPPADGGAAPASPTFCWQADTPYCPPDFAAWFPDSPEGAVALKELWEAEDRDRRPREEILAAIRNGLRRYENSPMPVLRWLGNRYIWNQTPQDAGAIELMYHATGAGGDAGEIRGAAIYFGLSTVRPMSPAILRTLMEVAVADDDPNNLSRIAWGIGDARDSALIYLKPYHESTDRAVREKADVVERIMKRELKAFEWARENARARAEKDFGRALPRLLEVLAQGQSRDRLRTLDLIEREGVMLITDETHIAIFAQCAGDPDPEVRRKVARMAGQQWVWSAREPNPEAVELMLAMSRDEDRDTRYNAVYYGLSTIERKDERLVRRLLEIAFDDREPNLYNRIEWGLRTQRELSRAVLDNYIALGNPQHAQAAREIYADMGGQERP